MLMQGLLRGITSLLEGKLAEKAAKRDASRTVLHSEPFRAAAPPGCDDRSGIGDRSSADSCIAIANRMAFDRETMRRYNSLLMHAFEALGLNQRQSQIALLVVKGYPYADIGQRLHMSESNVRYHMRNICTLAQVPDRHAFVQRVHAIIDSWTYGACCGESIEVGRRRA